MTMEAKNYYYYFFGTRVVCLLFFISHHKKLYNLLFSCKKKYRNIKRWNIINIHGEQYRNKNNECNTKGCCFLLLRIQGRQGTRQRFLNIKKKDKENCNKKIAHMVFNFPKEKGRSGV